MELEIPVLYRDANFLFVNKPSGLVVHRSKECADKESLVMLLRKQLNREIYPVQRLDRGVSGVIGFGLSSLAARVLQQALASETSRKEYLVLVRGATPENFLVQKPLTDERGIARECLTEFRTLASHAYCSLVEARIHSGRRHQIRRHLSHLSFHVLGDRHYGKGRLNNLYRDKYNLNRIFLHSHKVTLALPVEISNTLNNSYLENSFMGEYRTLTVHASLALDLQGVLVQMSDEGLLPKEKLLWMKSV